MTGRIVSTASVIVDLSLRVPSLPPVGGDVIASAPVYVVGGGFNLLYAAARQGAEIAYAGRYGSGPNGLLVRAELDRLGVACLQAPSTEGDTGVCITLVDARAERTFVTAPGVEATLTTEQLAGIDLRPDDFVTVSGYDLAYTGAGEALAAWVCSLPSGIRVLLDPGPLVLDIPVGRWDAVLGRVSVLTVNQREAELLAGSAFGAAEPLHAAVRLRHPLSAGALLVIRHGAAGCSFDGPQVGGGGDLTVTLVPAPAVTAIDTTGAGDTHAGVFLAEMMAGASYARGLLRANAAAALSVTRPGPASAPLPGEIDAALRGGPSDPGVTGLPPWPPREP